MREPSPAEKNTFGADVKLHPVTARPLQQGRGFAPHHQQALAHCDEIEAESDKETADAMRAKVNAYHARSDEEIAHDEAVVKLDAKADAIRARQAVIDADHAALEAEYAELKKKHAARRAAPKASGGLTAGHRYMTPGSEAAGAVESHGEPNPLGPGERYLTETEERAADKAAAKKK